MKTSSLILIVILLSSCNNVKEEKQRSTQIKSDTIYIHDTIYIDPENKNNWQKGFGLTHDPNVDSVWNKPVSYYLYDKELSPLAFEFYFGYFRPSDNGATDELLKYATTDNSKLRPFYRWCLNKTIQVSDGALAEHIGIPARRYAEKFPKEFFEYIDFDTTGTNYISWTGAIQYSGYYASDNYQNPNENRKKLSTKMKANCKNCSELTLKRIEKFAKDCFQ